MNRGLLFMNAYEEMPLIVYHANVLNIGAN